MLYGGRAGRTCGSCGTCRVREGQCLVWPLAQEMNLAVQLPRIGAISPDPIWQPSSRLDDPTALSPFL